MLWLFALVFDLGCSWFCGLCCAVGSWLSFGGLEAVVAWVFGYGFLIAVLLDYGWFCCRFVDFGLAAGL